MEIQRLKFGKKPREVNEKYLNFIREKICVVPLCNKKAEPHHLKSRGSWGSDYTCIPLCRWHHSEIEATGPTKFKDRWNVDVWNEAWNCVYEYFTKGGEAA